MNPIIESDRYSALDTPLTLETEQTFIAQFPPRGIFLVAEDPSLGRIVGLQTIEPFASYTHAFDHVAIIGTFVELTLRRRGIGAMLAQASFVGARACGFEQLFTYVRADNTGGLAYYQQLGFRVVGQAERQTKIGDRFVDEIIIERLI